MSDQAQQPANDFQKNFTNALESREVFFTVEARGAEGTPDYRPRRVVKIRRWGLGLQMQLSAALQSIVQSVFLSLPGIRNENGTLKTAPSELTAMASELLNLNTLFEKEGENIVKVLRGTLANNFPNADATALFVDSLDIPDVVQLLLLIAANNIITDTAKKKFAEVLKVAASKSESP